MTLVFTRCWVFLPVELLNVLWRSYRYILFNCCSFNVKRGFHFDIIMIRKFMHKVSLGFKTVCHLHVVGDSSFFCECDMLKIFSEFRNFSCCLWRCPYPLIFSAEYVTLFFLILSRACSKDALSCWFLFESDLRFFTVANCSLSLFDETWWICILWISILKMFFLRFQARDGFLKTGVSGFFSNLIK